MLAMPTHVPRPPLSFLNTAPTPLSRIQDWERMLREEKGHHHVFPVKKAFSVLYYFVGEKVKSERGGRRLTG